MLKLTKSINILMFFLRNKDLHTTINIIYIKEYFADVLILCVQIFYYIKLLLNGVSRTIESWIVCGWSPFG